MKTKSPYALGWPYCFVSNLIQQTFGRSPARTARCEVSRVIPAVNIARSGKNHHRLGEDRRRLARTS